MTDDDIEIPRAMVAQSALLLEVAAACEKMRGNEELSDQFTSMSDRMGTLAEMDER